LQGKVLVSACVVSMHVVGLTFYKGTLAHPPDARTTSKGTQLAIIASPSVAVAPLAARRLPTLLPAHVLIISPTLLLENLRNYLDPPST
jgi:hypothetical protein